MTTAANQSLLLRPRRGALQGPKDLERFPQVALRLTAKFQESELQEQPLAQKLTTSEPIFDFAKQSHRITPKRPPRITLSLFLL